MRKRLVAVTLSALLTALPLTGCTSGTQTTADSADKPAAVSPSATTNKAASNTTAQASSTSGSSTTQSESAKPSHNGKGETVAQDTTTGKPHPGNTTTDTRKSDKGTRAVTAQTAAYEQQSASKPRTTMVTGIVNDWSTYQPPNQFPDDIPTRQSSDWDNIKVPEPYTPTHGVKNVVEGAYCTNPGGGSTGTTADGKNMVCIVRAGEENPQWSPY